MVCVRYFDMIHKAVNDACKRILHGGGAIKMPSMTNGRNWCKSSMNGVRSHDPVNLTSQNGNDKMKNYSCIQLGTWPQHDYLQLVTLRLIQFKIMEGVDCQELPFFIPDKEPDFETTFQNDRNTETIAVNMEPGTCTTSGRRTPTDVRNGWNNASSCNAKSKKVG
jgi:hypothetical protein